MSFMRVILCAVLRIASGVESKVLRNTQL